MDFNLSAEHAELQQRTRLFIEEHVIPMEKDPRCTSHGPTDELRLELVAKARKAGLLSPHVSKEFGGLGWIMSARRSCSRNPATRRLVRWQ